MFVVYSDGENTLVTTRKREVQALEEFFARLGWDRDDFDRTEFKDDCFVLISNGNHSLNGSK